MTTQCARPHPDARGRGRPSLVSRREGRLDTVLPKQKGNLGEETASAGDVKASNARGVGAFAERSDRAKDADHAGQNPNGRQMR